jgi:NifB/MoaA-like Fe-S oxidoreductase
MLRNRRGATSLRWLRALLDHGVTVHGQLVVCPGVNDGAILDDTMVGVLDRYPDLASVCVVPLGLSRFNTEARMRPHTTAEAVAVVDTVHEWQAIFNTVLGRRLVYAADEYYLLADRPFPPAERYDGFPMHEDGIGMARTFEREFLGQVDDVVGPQRGFFAWADTAPPNPSAYTALRAASSSVTLSRPARRDAPVAILTAPYGAAVLGPLVARVDRPDVRLVAVGNDFFGGNIAVTGLMVGADLSRVLAGEPESHRYLLPDVCLTDGRFLDGQTPADLPRPVEVVATDGRALRNAIERA